MTENASVTTRRRNGAMASCEPCRKRKTRCDHRRPVCSQCRLRRQHLKCSYHPAPLTRKLTSGEDDSFASPGAMPGPVTRPDHMEDQQYYSKFITNTSTLPKAASYYPERRVNEFLSGAPTERQVDSASHGISPQSKSIHGEHVASIAKVLSHLRHFEFIHNLLITYYSASRASVIPGSLILCALPSLLDSITPFELFKDAADNDLQLLRFSETVLCSTSARINITTSLSPSDFMSLYTRENLRLEYLGITFSVAARSCLIGLAKDGEHQHNDFIRDMYHCSTTCLQLARDLTPINDMLVWFSQDHLMLTACIEGDSSKFKWYSSVE